ncbi:hypothetical protein [Spiroplasma citri]|uniref:Transmembrane protein n=1 Tax=Spiroplasma citri TaxID=2133 RepID=A0AAJ4EHU9_SPICI|nr:hypothetical protein [Spiroplasma citri]QED23986.1 hypothetical protein FRX96_00200 [Spiroplasma citri]QIA66271.1 hypothetical protein GMI18_00295 [Spiroplasma citri]QIA68122.1 hypothetical protein GL298_00295 [Spiroplasma citri]QIA69999.1 hypothetical protein GL981_00295 [Spiroplasma citri]QIA72231.1 hypothetical protein GL982_00295 [Spiroplasma citri]
MFVFLVTLGWSLMIIGAIVQIFIAILNLLVMQSVALPSILNSMNDIFQKSIFKQEQILSYLTGDIWGYTIIALTIFVALLVITLVSVQLHRVKKGQLIAKPYIKMIFVTLIIAALIYGKVAVLILAALMFIGLLFIESSLFDVEFLQNFVEERNMIVIYHQDKKLEREVNKEGKYHGSVTLGVDATIAGIGETERNFKNNDYVREDDSKKLSHQKSNSFFLSNELNNLFNSDKNDVDEHELANLINNMTQTMTNPPKPAVFETKLNTTETNLKQNESKELSKPPVVNEVEQQETSKLELEQLEEQNSSNDEDSQGETVAEIPLPFLDTKSNDDYKFNADIKGFVDKTAVNENNDFNESEDEKLNFSFLDDEFLNSSWAADKTMTRKEKRLYKRLYDKWSEMQQQALNIKQMVEEEVEIAEVKPKFIKKKAKIYNVLAKQANGLVKKLKLGPEHELKLMRIAEIFSNNSQATVDFLNDQILATDSNVIDNVLNDNINIDEKFNESSENISLEINTFNNVVDNDKTKKEIEIMNKNIKLENQEIQRTGIIFIPSDHNIDKLKGELLPDIKTSDDEESKTDNVSDNYDYPFAELVGLDDSQVEHNDEINSVVNENNYDDEIKPSEKNDLSELSVEQQTEEQIENNLAELVEDEIKPENELKTDAINLELTPDPLDTALANNMATDIFNIPMNEKENIILRKTEDSTLAEILTTNAEATNQLEVKTDESNENKEETYQSQLLHDVVSSEINETLQLEIKPILKEEVSYSLDELDDKIMNGDFSNLDDEVIEYFNQQKPEPIKETVFAEEPVLKEQAPPLQQVMPNDFECRFEKIEGLIKDSINLHTAHTKTLGEVQEHLKTLTLKVESLETKSADFAKKIKDVETKKHIKHHGVVPIDQFYPQISDINLVSTRYNLYNKKGYSNTYGVANSSESSYGLGNYYRTKNGSSSQEEISVNNNQFADYNHLNLHNISKYTKQDIPFETNCPFCKKNNK